MLIILANSMNGCTFEHSSFARLSSAVHRRVQKQNNYCNLPKFAKISIKSLRGCFMTHGVYICHVLHDPDPDFLSSSAVEDFSRCVLFWELEVVIYVSL